MTLPLIRSRLVLLSIAGALLASTVPAQTPKLDLPQASPTATLKQRIGLTDIEITYSRPSMKGRKIFGGLEAWGEVWRAGANNATKVVFSTPVKLNGMPLPAGTYGMFALIQPGEWQVIFSKISEQWGAYQYNAKDDVLRVPVKPTKLSQPVETFTIEFNDINNETATLNLLWENTRVALKLEVDVVGTVVPQIDAVMAAPGDKKPYVAAAMFYLDHNLDLTKALAWMNAAAAAQPKSFSTLYRKAKVQAAMGDNAGARTTATQAIAFAKEDKSPAGAEYVRLNETLIQGLK